MDTLTDSCVECAGLQEAKEDAGNSSHLSFYIVVSLAAAAAVLLMLATRYSEKVKDMVKSRRFQGKVRAFVTVFLLVSCAISLSLGTRTRPFGIASTVIRQALESFR